jgi:virulence-associated protein VagC
MSHSVRAKVFWSGGSQAIRVPKALRLPSVEVKMERRGTALLISPIQEDEGWDGFWDRLLSLKDPVRRWKTRGAERRRPL